MYSYTFLLTPSRNKSDIIFTEYIEIFLEAIDNINGGLAFKRDNKKLSISDHEISEKELKIILFSKMPLENPSRSLSSFTRYLTTYYTDMFRKYLYNKTLFSINLIGQESSDYSIDNFSPSNEEILKGIIDLLYSHTETKDVQIARSKIIDILKPFNFKN